MPLESHLEQQLRDALAAADRASKSKSEFLANMSHEIRTPLNAVIGLAYLLEQTPLNEEQRQFLLKIQFAGRALLGVVNNVLDLSKIEADEMFLEDVSFDLPALVRDVSQMLLPQAAAKGIELRIEPEESLPPMVMGDPTRMRQILTNLLTNAIKFTERGRVDLAVSVMERGSGHVRLRCEVRDTGIGIEPQACARLFTPFTQADASTTRRFGGTGLGLSIARRFVELMGGEIGVESIVGLGSTFWIELPLRIATPVDGTLRANALRILIVDPEGDTPRSFAAMVRALGWTPHVVATGEQLIAKMTASLELGRPDAIILDLCGRDAHDLIGRLDVLWDAADLPSIIVIADSAESYLEHKPHMRAGDVLLARPATSSALFNAINLAVSRGLHSSEESSEHSSERVFDSTNLEGLHPQWLSGVRVLVVDDSDINLQVAQRILENQGAAVTTCCDGALAIAHLRAYGRETDVVLMDVQMPVLDGNAATRSIRGELKLALPIVALTAGALVGERQRALDAGMDDFVSKPFDPQVLIRKVRRLVEQVRGEPIPMVFDEAPHAVRGDDGRPLMRCIDAGVVTQLFGADSSLFASMLARVLKEYADLSTPPSESSLDDAAVRLRLKARMHKLKGSAGMIGALSVMRFAGAAERALQEDRPARTVAGIITKLAAAISTLNHEALPLLGDRAQQVPADDPQVAGTPDVEIAELDELCSLLENQNLAAIDVFEALRPALQAMLGAGRYEELQDAVEELDFQRGAQVLREVARLTGEAA